MICKSCKTQYGYIDEIHLCHTCYISCNLYLDIYTDKEE